eukprot:gene13130-8976_t
MLCFASHYFRADGPDIAGFPVDRFVGVLLAARVVVAVMLCGWDFSYAAFGDELLQLDFADAAFVVGVLPSFLGMSLQRVAFLTRLLFVCFANDFCCSFDGLIIIVVVCVLWIARLFGLNGGLVLMLTGYLPMRLLVVFLVYCLQLLPVCVSSYRAIVDDVASFILPAEGFVLVAVDGFPVDSTVASFVGFVLRQDWNVGLTAWCIHKLTAFTFDVRLSC